jgi:threonyl-tRNA synthetase
MGPDNTEHPVFVIHRALYGSFERFIGILIEHYGGAFPFWLAPVQVRIISVGEDHRDAAEEIAKALREAGFRVDVDDRDETVGKRIRDGELEKIPKVIVYGDRESAESLSVRDRGGEQYQTGLVDLVRELATLKP